MDKEKNHKNVIDKKIKANKRNNLRDIIDGCQNPENVINVN